MTDVGLTDILATNLTVLATGVALDYANKAAFTGAGFNLTCYDNLGAALSPQPTWDLVRSDTDGDHEFSYSVPYDAFTWKMTVPGTAYSTATQWVGRGTTYGLDDLGGMIAASGSVAIAEFVTISTYTWYDTDSLDVSVSVTEAALASIGAASLTACDTRRAYIKLTSAASGAAPTVDYTAITVTITTDTSGTRILRCVIDAFPAALAVPSGSTSIQAKLMVTLGEGSKLLTVAEVSLTIVWTAKDGAA